MEEEGTKSLFPFSGLPEWLDGSYPLSSWGFGQLIGEPHSTIRVTNLQASMKAGKDAWGRCNVLQPLFISVKVTLAKPFQSASVQDSVNNSTVHYGTLSKKILKICQELRNLQDQNKDDVLSLQDLITGLQSALVKASEPESGSSLFLNLEENSLQQIESLELKIMLPKASLIGNGASLTSAVGNFSYPPVSRTSTLRLHDLRVVGLIGVNPNERLAKQIIVANIEVDYWFESRDYYDSLEQIVVRTIEETSFETLEALANCISKRVFKYWLIPRNGFHHCGRLRICLEKPTAVTFADAPAIEVLMDSQTSESVKSLWAMEESNGSPFPTLKSPLRTSLQDWINQNDPDGI